MDEISYKLAFENGKLQEHMNAVAVFKKIIVGCKNVIDEDCHNDAKTLARLIIRDCNAFIECKNHD